MRSALRAATYALVLLGSALSLRADEWPLKGDLGAHDPTVLQEGAVWYAFTTGKGLPTKTSTDVFTWKQGSPLFTAELSWWRTWAPNMGQLDVWAPDLHVYNGRVWCFYSVSEFGKNNSAIGLKSATSLAAGDWRDDGLVIGSKSGTDAYNAIDPNLTIDTEGRPWLVFGSFFDGIHITALDPATMKPTGTLFSIAKRANGVEGANVVFRNGYYYLFVSIDKCCQGVNSTYKIAYGRSKSITGPYVDKDGGPMLNGGGTILEAGGDRWKGPGGQDVYDNNGTWVIARHAYDAVNNGAPTLRIADLYWDSSDWPTLTKPIVTNEPPKPGRLTNLSLRSHAGSGDGTLIAGFIISGSGEKPVMIRGTGPTLTHFSVNGVLGNPLLELYNTVPTLIDSNDSWRQSPNLAAIEAAKGTTIGDVRLDDKEAIVLRSLSAGGYTAQLKGPEGDTGVALIELFDTDTAEPGSAEFAAQPRLTNISARAEVGAGEAVLIAGFTINGNVPKHLLVRGTGGTLANYHLSGLLADPLLELHALNGDLVAQNDNWADAPNLAAIQAANGDHLGEFALAVKDAVLLATLAPGGYTAVLRGVNGATGVGLIEVFDLD
ncbi:MAG TPA: glycoside hydrolase family 43 protein [Opitutaceae bacterium]|nr:glycoside hydrolase family 43 protein [Opitutaceae bacterium]